ncbi:MAG: hypothetical protein M1821_001582 [Bathelium mastoideum]|nr:MAG: hypothetical protein M1821_001582 [Bathelium mastoideum]
MARYLLTNADEVISAIVVDMQMEGLIPFSDAIDVDGDSYGLCFKGDPAVLFREPSPLDADYAIDLQAELDTVDQKRLWQDSLVQNPELKRKVEEKLDGDLVDSVESIRQKPLEEKVKYWFQKKYPKPPLKRPDKDTICIRTIAELNNDGTPASLSQKYIPYDTTWFEFLRILKLDSITYDFELEEYSKGYDIKDGPWQYQFVENHHASGISNSGDEAWEKLADELAYRGMKKALRKRGGTNVEVVLRHKQTSMQSRALKAEYDDHWASVDRACSQMVDENGDPYFDSDSRDLGLCELLKLGMREIRRTDRERRRAKGETNEHDRQEDQEDKMWLEARKDYWQKVDQERAMKRREVKKARSTGGDKAVQNGK